MERSAGKGAAAYYDMQILREGIEDIEQNYTRFVILQKIRETTEEADKTSVVFSLNNIPGALFKSLSVFALRDIDLAKIESRPLHGSPWSYFFYVDFFGAVDDPRSVKALDHLQEITTFFKVLGSYKQGKSIEKWDGQTAKRIVRIVKEKLNI